MRTMMGNGVAVDAAATEKMGLTLNEYKKGIEEGRRLTQEIRILDDKLLKARMSGASAVEVESLNLKLREKASEINASYSAKVYLKSNADPGAAIAKGCYFLETYDGKKSAAASDGYWIMLRPLKAGKHVIRFGGQYANSFSRETLYELMVK